MALDENARLRDSGSQVCGRNKDTRSLFDRFPFHLASIIVCEVGTDKETVHVYTYLSTCAPYIVVVRYVFRWYDIPYTDRFEANNSRSSYALGILVAWALSIVTPITSEHFSVALARNFPIISSHFKVAPSKNITTSLFLSCLPV